MGSWDNGLLDNDTSLDYIGLFTTEVEQNIISIHENSTRQSAGALSAGVGILLRLGHRFEPMPTLAPPPHFYPRLISALSANMLRLLDFPGNSAQVLAAVLCGHGEQLASRPAGLAKPILNSLFGGKSKEMSRQFSKLEYDLFLHPSAKKYLVTKSKSLIQQIDACLKDRQDVIDMSSSFLGGMIGLLLILPIQGLSPKKIQSWRERCENIWDSAGANEEANDITFERGFRKKVTQAFTWIEAQSRSK